MKMRKKAEASSIFLCRNLNRDVGFELYHLNNHMKATTVLLFIAIMLALCAQTYAETSLVTCKKPSQDKSTCHECRTFYHLFEGQCYINILGC